MCNFQQLSLFSGVREAKEPGGSGALKPPDTWLAGWECLPGSQVGLGRMLLSRVA